MDAEGAEPEVLKGATQILKNVRAAAIDCGPEREGETTIDSVRSVLQRAGFRVHLSDRGPSQNIVFGWKEDVASFTPGDSS